MISDIDIKDWVCVEQPELLYTLPRDSLVSYVDDPTAPFLLGHVDGMYSYSQTLDGTVFHPAAWAKVFVWRKIGG